MRANYTATIRDCKVRLDRMDINSLALNNLLRNVSPVTSNGSNDSPVHDLIAVPPSSKRKRETNVSSGIIPPTNRAKVRSCKIRLDRIDINNLASNGTPKTNEEV